MLPNISMTHATLLTTTIDIIIIISIISNYNRLLIKTV